MLLQEIVPCGEGHGKMEICHRSLELEAKYMRMVIDALKEHVSPVETRTSNF